MKYSKNAPRHQKSIISQTTTFPSSYYRTQPFPALFPTKTYEWRPNPTRCTNYVSRFGERCKLCVIVKEGHSLTRGLLPDELWMTPAYNDQNAQGSKSEKKSGSSSVGYLASWLGK
ncbi:hypothetical protein QBC40DRAFT_281353 [Triangularia verruculosa]|uniref:Uncharacterized protein n=1 Tax=Triangularia verruculosa TaxID=2587418 RepID=A0AAN7AUL8_9PEZI|nr:hypothetical protein QBC40DRAFT_281353 [Triangularia verruculosa]